MCKTCDLILVRHEEAEGNVALTRSKFQGDNRGFTDELRSRPSDSWHLTDRGKRRCVALGDWLRTNIFLGPEFRFLVSPVLRAVETANHSIPQANWIQDRLLRGRKWGGIECIPWEEWPSFCKTHGCVTFPDGFREAYPNGETMAEVLERFKEFVASSGAKTLAITHGEVLLVARMLFEGIPEDGYRMLGRNGDHVRYGQATWYSRRNPRTGVCSDAFCFKRTWFDGIDTGWVEIQTPG